MMKRKVTKGTVTKRNQVSSFDRLNDLSMTTLVDEDDDLSEGDVSADPVEGKCKSCLFVSTLLTLFRSTKR